MSDDKQKLTAEEKELLEKEDAAYDELHNFLNDFEISSGKLSGQIETELESQNDALDRLEGEISKIESSLD